MLGDVHRRPEVDLEEVAAALDRGAFELAEQAVAGVVDDDVDAGELRQGGVEGGADGRLGSQVDGLEERVGGVGGGGEGDGGGAAGEGDDAVARVGEDGCDEGEAYA